MNDILVWNASGNRDDLKGIDIWLCILYKLEVKKREYCDLYKLWGQTMWKKLSEVCTFYTGTGFPIKFQGKTQDELPFYKVGDIANNIARGNTYLKTCNNYISEKEAKEIKGIIIPPNTIVFAKIGEALRLNRRAITSVRCLVDNNVMGIAPLEAEVSMKYFYYFMCNLKMELLAESTTVPSVRKSKLEEVKIELPDMCEQHNIEKKLDTIKGIIQLRKKQLELLDNLIKSRFVEMFGEYPANPRRWEVGTIKEVVADVRYGSSRPAVDGGKYPYLRMNNITYSGELDLTDIKRINVPESELEKCTVRRGDVLFNRTNSKELVGKTCVYNRDEMMVLAGFVIRVRVNERVLPDFLSAFLNTDFSKKMLSGMCKAAIGQANINAREVQNIGIYIPPVELQRQFVQFKEQTTKLKLVG